MECDMDVNHIQENKEIWKPAYGWESYYEVSNMGRIRRIERVIIKSNGRKNTYRAKELTPSKDSKGYFYIKVRDVGKNRNERRNIRIHRLICATFLGPSDLLVDHKNFDRTDNRLSNLQYVTDRENSDRYHGIREMKHIYYDKKKNRWQSYIMINGKSVYVGSTKCFEKMKQIRDSFIKDRSIGTRPEIY